MFLQDSNSWDQTSSYTTYPDELLQRCSKYSLGPGGMNAPRKICSMFDDHCDGVDTLSGPLGEEPWVRIFNVIGGLPSIDPQNWDAAEGHALATSLRRPTDEELDDMHILGIRFLPWNYSPWLRVNAYDQSHVYPMNVLHPENLVSNGTTVAKIALGGMAVLFLVPSLIEMLVSIVGLVL